MPPLGCVPLIVPLTIGSSMSREAGDDSDLLSGGAKGGGQFPTQASTTASPRRMVPPLTTEA
jgi:hypothetical protein